jgi:hypothetical protein
MKVFNHLLLRVAALPYEVFTTSKAGLTNAYVAFFLAKEEMHRYKETVSRQLQDFNQTVTDPRNQQVIQNVRKKIFQLKQLKEQELVFFNTLPATVRSIAREYCERSLHIDHLRKQFYTVYDQLLTRERENIQALSHHEVFLKGIALSSHILYRDIVKYQSKRIQAFKSDESHTEKTVLKYLSRIVTKTTPFSTFTNIGTASLKKMNGCLYTFQQPGQAVIQSFFTVSAILMARIKHKAFSTPQIAQHLPIRLNKTLQKRRGYWSFVTYSNNGNHDFKQLTGNEAVNTVIQILSSQPGLSMTMLSKQLITLFDEAEGSILSFLFNLLDIGIFELSLDINLSDPSWAETLEQELRRNMTDAAAEGAEIHFQGLLRVLSHIKQMVAAFPACNGSERITALRQLQHEADTFLSVELENKAEKGTSLTEKLIYEDTNITCGLALNSSYINSFAAKMSDLFQSLSVLEPKKFSARKAYNYFCSKYPKRGVVPFLDFYEQYFKEILQPEVSGSEENKQEHFSSLPHIYEQLKEEGTLLAEWKALLIKQLPVDIHADTIQINLPTIQDINRQLKTTPQKNSGSLGVFIQPVFVPQVAQPLTVVNAMYGSYGKMFSRFLGILPKKITTDLGSEIYETLSSEGHAVEINDPSLHNANIYPNILHEELKLPGGRFSHPEGQQIQLTELVIKRNTKEKSLYIVDKRTQKRIFPIDFGFQALDYRIELFQFLNLFSPVSAVSHTLLLDIINTYLKETAARENLPFQVRPRIVYEHDIILQRKTWIIPPAYLPIREATMDNQTYFENIQLWKEQFHLPGQVFVKRRRADLSGKTDDYKPQFIDLQSPLHLLLLEKIILKNDKADLIIEEALPTPDQTLVMGEAHFTTEFFVQINC